jgi:ATP-dependent DNA helicase RecG
MAGLDTDVRYVKGIGEARAKALAKVGVTDLRSLISYFPRDFEDRRSFLPIRELQDGKKACVLAMAATVPTTARIRQGLTLTKVRAVDDSGSMTITFFNQPYVKNSIERGQTYAFYGEAETGNGSVRMTNPLFEKEGANAITGRIVPVYPLTAGISQTVMSRAIRQGLDAGLSEIEDALPESIRRGHSLCGAQYAYENIHFPQSFDAADRARRRIVFEELFLLSAGLSLLREKRSAETGPSCGDVDMTPFFAALPFEMTGAQKRAVDEALSDMRGGAPMNRLCQGDVGSGKTMVAAACVYFAVRNGWQAAMMAPTELLARQHFSNLAPLMEKFGIRCELLTGSLTAKQKREAYSRIALGEADFVIGTHALISGGVEFPALGLVVADEQHRFGVNQRAALSAKAASPHVLVMSATPIPRTLALIIYGDLDVSVIDELPPGRQKTDTFAVPSSYRGRVYKFIRKLVGDGRQAYIVCPAVGGPDTIPDERKTVTDYAKTLRESVFPDLRVGMVHGRMKSAEKEKAMESFARGETDVLVATTVIEVGVDVPNAAVMLIENADRFGLSQLHQLRGRVGRGSEKSYCILVSDAAGGEAKARLKIMCESCDGFRISEEDLKIRGPGDFFGSRQHGLPDLKMADLSCDMRLLREAQDAANALLAADPALSSPEDIPVRRRIEELFRANADMMN